MLTTLFLSNQSINYTKGVFKHYTISILQLFSSTQPSINDFSTGPDEVGRWQRATFFLFFIHGTSIGLAVTNHALLSLVTNLVHSCTIYSTRQVRYMRNLQDIRKWSKIVIQIPILPCLPHKRFTIY